MINIIHDCDNTIGLHGCDIDDALALIYLLGQEDVNLPGVTCSYGNSTQEKVYSSTVYLFQSLNIKNIPIIKGCDSGKIYPCPASNFIVNKLTNTNEKIILLVTGAVSNIYLALKNNSQLIPGIQEIIFMGGIIRELFINGKKMNELNFSIDPDSSHFLLNLPVKKTIITGNLCLDLFLDKNKLEILKRYSGINSIDFIIKHSNNWSNFLREKYGNFGFHLWDVAAACYIIHPELFNKNYVSIHSSIDDLKCGLLKITKSNDYITNIPDRINNIDMLWDKIIQGWKNFKFNNSLKGNE